MEASFSSIYKLTEHYRKYLLAFEFEFDRGGIDPEPILAEWEEYKQALAELKAVLEEKEDEWGGELNVIVNNSERQLSHTPSLGSQDSVYSLISSDSSSVSDSEALRQCGPTFGPEETSCPTPIKASPGASCAEILCLIILTLLWLLIYNFYLLYA